MTTKLKSDVELAHTKLSYHRFANAFPLMNGDEFEKFVADIKSTNGPLERITLYQGEILEGRNRYRACLRLKIEPPPTIEFEGDDAAAYAFVISKNIHRRHLKPADKKKVAANLLKMKPEQSDRSIAEQVGVSPTTVGIIREEVEAESTVQSGQLSEKPKRVGADGKARKQPAKKKRRTIEDFKRDIAKKAAATEHKAFQNAHKRTVDFSGTGCSTGVALGNPIIQAWEANKPYRANFVALYRRDLAQTMADIDRELAPPKATKLSLPIERRSLKSGGKP